MFLTGQDEEDRYTISEQPVPLHGFTPPRPFLPRLWPISEPREYALGPWYGLLRTALFSVGSSNKSWTCVSMFEVPSSSSVNLVSSVVVT